MKKILIFVVVLIATSLISGISGVQARGISGRVTDESGNGIADVYVGVYDRRDTYWINGSPTDSNGNYNVDVPAGIYKVFFSPSPYTGYYAPKWYDNRSNFQIAKLVRVTAFRPTTNINAQLEIGGAISGRVTNVSGNGIADVYVGAYDFNDKWIASSFTDGDGNCRFNVPAGTYKVYFVPSPSSGYNAPEWYDSKNNGSMADLVTVTTQTTVNIDANLGFGGTISGRVTDTSGEKGVVGVFVSAFDPTCIWVTGSNTDGDGNYSFNVPAGTYKVQINRPSINRSGYYVPEWYDNKRKCEQADLVTVTVLQTTFNIDARFGFWK